MKRIMIGVLVVLLLAAAGGVVRAQEGAEVEAGVKFWYNDWHSSGPPGNLTSDHTLLLGPAVGVWFRNHVYLDGSFLFSTSDYKFPDGTKFDRKDLEVAVGYMITDFFGLQAGYKNVWLDETTPGVDFNETMYGPMLGAVGNIPVNEIFSLYATLNYLFTRFQVEDAGITVTEDSPGWFVEGGAKFAFTQQFIGTIGYKYETSKGKDSDVKDEFSGFTFGALFAF